MSIFVKHESFERGRVLSVSGTNFVIKFDKEDDPVTIAIGNVTRTYLPIGTPCETEDGVQCTIKRLEERGRKWDPNTYRVELQDGLEDVFPETILIPGEMPRPSDPLEALSTLQHGSCDVFNARNQLSIAYGKLVQRGAGVHSILSSRIDLHPHQAYVAATVISDSEQRYLLADEVGLGKTIEAGIIIHDLLAKNRRAKVLVLCPGALVQQWLSEMYSKFCGEIFKLPEISGLHSLGQAGRERVILSFHAAIENQEALSNVEWDMVVVDEVHHLLRSKPLYKIVQDLSRKEKGLLLLSAVPAKQRDQEYYNLLALLDPKKYPIDDAKKRKASQKKFSGLFDRQREISRRIDLIERRRGDLAEGEDDAPDRILKQVKFLLKIPALAKDSFLSKSCRKLDPKDGEFDGKVEEIIRHISNYYRINRRILRNRREKLIEAERMQRIERKVCKEEYEADQFEITAKDALQRLIRAIRDSEMDDHIRLTLSKQLFQASIHPTTLLDVLKKSEHEFPPDRTGEELANLDDLVSYDEWDDLLEDCWWHARDHIESDLIQETVEAISAWDARKNNRTDKWGEILRKKHRDYPDAKYILFAGFPRLAKLVTETLQDTFPGLKVAKFYHGMGATPDQERTLKEKEIRRFKVDRATWLLVCDETGGEGRNFQFATELFHYDLPLQPSKIEQRIGRLDRLGREQKDVTSNVLVAGGSDEEAWFTCLSEEGLGVFSQSISGIEFGLREIEQDVAMALMSDDDQALKDMPPVINQKVEEERSLDESQEQMDTASFNRPQAAKFRKVQSTEYQDVDLEYKFKKYFKLNSKNGVREHSEEAYPKGIFTFFADNIKGIQLDLFDDNNAGAAPNYVHKGTFRRKIAQERPDLKMFSIGNSFFDSVCRSLTQDIAGRTYAVECQSKLEAWEGFHFSYRIKSGGDSDLNSKHKNFLDFFFTQKTEHVFINSKKEIFEQGNELLFEQTKFDRKREGRSWWNLTGTSNIHLTNHYPDWMELVRTLESVAQKQARRGFKAQLVGEIKNECALLEGKKKMLEQVKPEGWKEEVKAIEELKNTLKNWDLALDTAGFLSINGSIRNV